MNYAEIKNCDIANGPGVRVTLFVSGCTHHCKNCFNQETWDFAHNYCGRLWTKIGWITLFASILSMLFTFGKGENAVGFIGGILMSLQCVFLVGSIFPVEFALKKRFDKDGNRI